MDASRRTYGNEYVVGNTVRRMQEDPYREKLPVRRRPLTEEEFRRLAKRKQLESGIHVSRTTRRNIRSIDLGSLLVLSMAIFVTLYVCVSFLKVQSSITSMSKETARLESELVDLQNENNAAYERINTSITLSEIYKVATKKMGMVHSDPSQIINYQSAKSDYVRKYADIPEEKTPNPIERFLN